MGREIHPKPGSLPDETQHLVAVLYNAHSGEHDFFELKRVAECLFPKVELSAAEPHIWEHPFRTAEMRLHNLAIGRLFELHPSLLEAKKIEGRAFLLDVNLDLAQTVARVAAPYEPCAAIPPARSIFR